MSVSNEKRVCVGKEIIFFESALAKAVCRKGRKLYVKSSSVTSAGMLQLELVTVKLHLFVSQ